MVIIKARKVLRYESLKCLHYSFIYPYMIYCNQIWGSACKTNIEPLQVLQQRAVWTILGVHRRSPSEPLLTTLKFLNCRNIFKYLIGLLMYRIYHGELHVLHGLLRKIAIYTYMILVRIVIIICLCVGLTWGCVVWDMWALLYGTTFLVLTTFQTSARLFSLGVLMQQYVITYFNWSNVPHVLLIHNYW